MITDVADYQRTQTYIAEYKRWMDEWKPDVFVTINLPCASSAPQTPEFYLSLWTKAAERDLFGRRILKSRYLDNRLVWLLRQEVSAGAMVHYHGVGKLPVAREVRSASALDICSRIERSLRRASQRTPEPHRQFEADINVKPYDADRNHGGYMLKGMRWDVPAHRRSVSTLFDSDLLVLPRYYSPVASRLPESPEHAN